MYKKIFSGLILAIALIFTFSVCFAADGNGSVVNGIRNVMGGAENAMNSAAHGVGNAVQNAGNAIREGAGAIGNKVQEGANDNNNYTATRTSADNTIMGMNSTVWTWVILGVAGIGIIALVWYYSSQVNSQSQNDDRN